MPLIKSKDNLKRKVITSRPRDEKGKFIKIPNIIPSKNVVENFLLSHTGNYKDQDDLLDIKIGNPLGRIIRLLEEIKHQKAFSFTLKGSLGIAGVILTLSVFGIFGGSQIICDKGRQTFIGTIKVLDAREIYSKKVPVLSHILDLVAPPLKQIKHRTILVKPDNTTVYMPFNEQIDFRNYEESIVFATGEYNTCNNEVVISEASDLQKINR